MKRGLIMNKIFNRVQNRKTAESPRGGRLNRESGQASIMTAVMFILLFSVVTVSFTHIMSSNSRQTINNELSARALAAAESGIEDAKRILAYCLGTTPTPSACAGIVSATNLSIDGQTCVDTNKLNLLSNQLGLGNRVNTGTGVVTVNEDNGEAYLCLKIAPRTADYTGFLTADSGNGNGSSAIIPLKFVNAAGQPTRAAFVTLEWHSLNAGANGDGGLASITAGNDLPALNQWANPASIRLETVVVGKDTDPYDRTDSDSAARAANKPAMPFTINELVKNARAVTLRPSTKNNNAKNCSYTNSPGGLFTNEYVRDDPVTAQCVNIPYGHSGNVVDGDGCVVTQADRNYTCRVPAGALGVTIKSYGGGGGGGGANITLYTSTNDNYVAAGSGGYGGEGKTVPYGDVTVDTVFDIMVGKGGEGGDPRYGDSADGDPGGDTIVYDRNNDREVIDARARGGSGGAGVMVDQEFLATQGAIVGGYPDGTNDPRGPVGNPGSFGQAASRVGFWNGGVNCLWNVNNNPNCQINVNMDNLTGNTAAGISRCEGDDLLGIGNGYFLGRLQCYQTDGGSFTLFCEQGWPFSSGKNLYPCARIRTNDAVYAVGGKGGNGYEINGDEIVQVANGGLSGGTTGMNYCDANGNPYIGGDKYACYSPSGGVVFGSGTTNGSANGDSPAYGFSAGGGGGLAYTVRGGSNTTIRGFGGRGGNGYVEITWQEHADNPLRKFYDPRAYDMDFWKPSNLPRQEINVATSPAQECLFREAGAYTCEIPAGAENIRVEIYSAGGGGGGASIRPTNGTDKNLVSAGGGGAGGRWINGNIPNNDTASPRVYDVTVGAGGAGGNPLHTYSGAENGRPGGASSIFIHNTSTVIVGVGGQRLTVEGGNGGSGGALMAAPGLFNYVAVNAGGGAAGVSGGGSGQAGQAAARAGGANGLGELIECTPGAVSWITNAHNNSRCQANVGDRFHMNGASAPGIPLCGVGIIDTGLLDGQLLCRETNYSRITDDSCGDGTWHAPEDEDGDSWWECFWNHEKRQVSGQFNLHCDNFTFSDMAGCTVIRRNDAVYAMGGGGGNGPSGSGGVGGSAVYTTGVNYISPLTSTVKDCGVDFHFFNWLVNGIYCTVANGRLTNRYVAGNQTPGVIYQGFLNKEAGHQQDGKNGTGNSSGGGGGYVASANCNNDVDHWWKIKANSCNDVIPATGGNGTDGYVRIWWTFPDDMEAENTIYDSTPLMATKCDENGAWGDLVFYDPNGPPTPHRTSFACSFTFSATTDAPNSRYGLTNACVFETAGNYTCQIPANAYNIRMTTLGAGGGGGGGSILAQGGTSANLVSAGAGGGGGGRGEGSIQPANYDRVVDVTVGAGGRGGNPNSGVPDGINGGVSAVYYSTQYNHTPTTAIAWAAGGGGGKGGALADRDHAGLFGGYVVNAALDGGGIGGAGNSGDPGRAAARVPGCNTLDILGILGPTSDICQGFVNDPTIGDYTTAPGIPLCGTTIFDMGVLDGRMKCRGTNYDISINISWLNFGISETGALFLHCNPKRDCNHVAYNDAVFAIGGAGGSGYNYEINPSNGNVSTTPASGGAQTATAGLSLASMGGNNYRIVRGGDDPEEPGGYLGARPGVIYAAWNRHSVQAVPGNNGEGYGSGGSGGFVASAECTNENKIFVFILRGNSCNNVNAVRGGNGTDGVVVITWDMPPGATGDIRTTYPNIGYPEWNSYGGLQAYLRLNAIYRDTHFRVTARDFEGNELFFDGVQPVVDVTGRANDAYRRIESRLAPAAAGGTGNDALDGLWWPEYAIESGGVVSK